MTERLEAVHISLFQYKENDRLGRLLAHVSLLPLLSIFSLGAASILPRLSRAAYAMVFVGALFCELGNIAMKRLIKQKRPPQCPQETRNASEYGMPSDHCGILCFIAVSLMMLWTNRYGLDVINSKGIPVNLLILICMTVISRVYLHYHTVWQCLAGCLYGSVFGYLWTLYFSTYQYA